MYNRAKKYIKKNKGLKSSVESFVEASKKHGLKNVFLRAAGMNFHGDKAYQKWIAENERVYKSEEIARRLENLTYNPLISILVPIYNVEAKYLKECIDSVVDQYYQNWELCLADDKSTSEHIRPMLEEYAEKDSRINVIFRKENGHISAATNSALDVATGEFIALLDNDDFIKKEALLEIVTLLNKNPDADMIYTDEDKVDQTGKKRSGPFFKPNWSPDAFLGHMYLCHMGVYRKSIAQEIGGFRIGYEGAQDYDFVLRFTEKTNKIYHVPKILYHWRMLPSSTASGAENKDYAYLASLKAKDDALKRRGYKFTLEENLEIHSTNVYYHPNVNSMVSIIIPTKNHGNDLEICLKSIYEKTTWLNFEIIIVDNGSDEQETLDLLNKYKKEKMNFRILKLDVPFNYSLLNNRAVDIANGNYILFLNNDTQVLTDDWMERMLGQAELDYTGAVGAKLLYPDDTIQHSGVVLYDVGPGHAFQYSDRYAVGYFGRLKINYNYLAITGAALMVAKEKFQDVGGFDEENLQVAYNDVDLCLRLYQKGYYNVVRNDVELYHYESKSRGYDTTSEKEKRLENERKYLDKKWKHLYEKGDPFYNENLIGNHSDFSYRKK